MFMFLIASSIFYESNNNLDMKGLPYPILTSLGPTQFNVKAIPKINLFFICFYEFNLKSTYHRNLQITYHKNVSKKYIILITFN